VRGAEERKKGGRASNLLDQLKRYFCVGFFLRCTNIIKRNGPKKMKMKRE
jgi:hypothetical protein